MPSHETDTRERPLHLFLPLKRPIQSSRFTSKKVQTRTKPRPQLLVTANCHHGINIHAARGLNAHLDFEPLTMLTSAYSAARTNCLPSNSNVFSHQWPEPALNSGRLSPPTCPARHPKNSPLIFILLAVVLLVLKRKRSLRRKEPST